MPIWVYDLVKTLHILFAIVAVGFNVSYAVWLVRGRRSPEHLDFALRGVKFMDDYIANPCYVLLLISGLAMAFVVGSWGFQRWIVSALVLWVAAILLAYLGYTPTLSRQIRVLAAEGPESAEFQRLDARGRWMGPLLGVIVLVILVLMVFKPTI
ncbi:MAG TPA: DUF2269 family protein [Candidatus Dormibacteraeota bacterium]